MLRPGFISRGAPLPEATPFQDAVLALAPLRYWPNARADPIPNVGTFGTDDFSLGGATPNVTGPLSSGDSKAFTTDGVDDAPSPGTVDLTGTSAVSVLFFMDWDESFAGSSNVDAAQILGFGNPAGAGWAAFQILANGAGVGVWRVDNYGQTFEFSPVSDGWHLWLVVIDHGRATNEITLYIDGAEVSGTRPSNTDQAGAFGNETFYLGHRGLGGGATPLAKWAHPAIFTTALTATDAATLWAAR